MELPRLMPRRMLVAYSSLVRTYLEKNGQQPLPPRLGRLTFAAKQTQSGHSDHGPCFQLSAISGHISWPRHTDSHLNAMLYANSHFIEVMDDREIGQPECV